MCNNATKQEILALLALSTHSGEVSEDHLIGEIGRLAEKVGWPPYLDHLPLPVHELLKSLSAPNVGASQRVRTRYWISTEKTEDQLNYLIQQHAPAMLKSKLEKLNRQAA